MSGKDIGGLCDDCETIFVPPKASCGFVLFVLLCAVAVIGGGGAIGLNTLT